MSSDAEIFGSEMSYKSKVVLKSTMYYGFSANSLKPSEIANTVTDGGKNKIKQVEEYLKSQEKEEGKEERNDPDVNRYMECYLDNKIETVTTFDPVLYLMGVIDNWKTFKDEICMCNREPYCDCKDETSCLCDDDNDVEITFDMDIVSNCKCNLVINLKDKKYTLDPTFFWRALGISSNTEVPLLDINPIDNSLIFYLNGKAVSFDLEDKPVVKSKQISIQFNYMNFSTSDKDEVEETEEENTDDETEDH